MSKFKVGDRVRKVRGIYSEKKPIGVVEGHQGGQVRVRLDNPSLIMGGYSTDMEELYELVEAPAPEESELERLVRVANEGVDAEVTLRTKYRDQIEDAERVYQGPSVSRTGGQVSIYKLRIKPKPAFEPFYVGPGSELSPPAGGWLVKLEGETLHIGCKRLKAKDAKEALRFLCKGNGAEEYKTAGFSVAATRTGVCSLDGEISWADADKILAALEKAGV